MVWGVYVVVKFLRSSKQKYWKKKIKRFSPFDTICFHVYKTFLRS